MAPETAITLQLSSIDELFTAPAVDPFSTHAVDILGEAGLDVAQKRVLQHFPRLPRAVHLTIELPAEQFSSGLTERVSAAAQRYFAHRIEDNRLQRQLAVRYGFRQLLGASMAIVLALAFIAVLATAPLGVVPAFVRGVLIVLALYACSVLSFDAVWSLVFDWVPYVQENRVYRVLEASEIRIEPAPAFAE